MWFEVRRRTPSAQGSAQEMLCASRELDELGEEVTNTKMPALRLPKPKLDDGKSFAKALRLRRTVRDMTDRKLSSQLLSNVLFAACGVNRAQGPFGALGVTAASASNSQEIDIYVALERGAYRFVAEKHALELVLSDDIRRLAFGPRQRPVSPNAPVQLLYVVDLDKLEHTSGFEEPGLHDAEVQKSYYFVDTGIIAANVYLLAASDGLACWFHNCDRSGLAKKLELRKTQRVLFAQTVGYPSSRRESASGATPGRDG